MAFSHVDGATFLAFDATWYSGRVLQLLAVSAGLPAWGAYATSRRRPLEPV